MTDNILVNENGIEIYQTDIDVLCDDYINSLPDPSMIYKTSVFKGLLLYINQRYLCNILQMDKQNRNSVFNNYVLLDSIFNNIYLPLTYKYNMVPTVLEFCVFTGQDTSHVSDLRKGIYRNDGTKVNPNTTQIVKSWYSVAESALASKAFSENSVGCIFGLKSAHGWQETPQQVEMLNTYQQDTPQQIAERFRNAEKPRMIAESES